MKTINFLYNIILDRDPQVVFFRLPVWDRGDLSKALLNDVIVNKSKIKRFTEWLKDMRKKEKVKFTTKKAGK